MFESVLKPRRAPRGRVLNGVAFAIAVHAWLLVAMIARARPSQATEEPAPKAIDLVLASSPNPPPLGAGGPPPKGGGRPKSRPPSNAFRPPNPDARPAATAVPASTAVSDAPPTPGDDTGDGPDGDPNGVDGGTGTGDPNGVEGGTGTGPGSAGPPATYTTLHIGDASLDQSTCQIGGQPPYPREALAAKVEGTVLTRCVVEPTGALSGCEVLKAPYSFEAPVKSFLATAHARPFTAAGKPVRVQCVFKFTYKLDN